MKTISVYETDTSLLISNRIRYSNDLSKLSPFVIQISPVLPKVDVIKSIKLTVFRGKLFITVSSVYAGRFIDPSYRQTSSYRIIPHMPGKMAPYILPDNIPVINAFLDKHFPDVEIKPLNQYEIDDIKEMRFLDDKEEQSSFTAIESMNDIKPLPEVADENKEKVVLVIARISSIAFPVYAFFDVSRTNDGFYYAGYLPDTSLRNYHFASDLREFLTALFGVYRKDLARTVVTKNLLQIYWAANFVNILDIESIIASLEKLNRVMEVEWFNMNILEEFPRKVKRSLLENVSGVDPVLVQDALNMAAWIPERKRRKCTSWLTLHDTGMLHYSLESSEVGFIEPPEELNRFFSEAKFHNLEVEPLVNPELFIATGSEMNVCVGSMPYIMSSVEDKGYCFRLNNSLGQAEALVEVVRHDKENPHKWKVNQVRGNHNAKVDEELEKYISAELSKYIQL